ncbi:hypothetical protein ZHAS_00017260 [Anopheles sinensis]|uniref:Uncharacterized protein n=1 Tax=Anopheles sinensis TaxID=74873 RepID=A0A084WFW4_ANOSI|nr:hypothetical protein ZHAS_00017260 [Anopheles sinensis]
MNLCGWNICDTKKQSPTYTGTDQKSQSDYDDCDGGDGVVRNFVNVDSHLHNDDCYDDSNGGATGPVTFHENYR